MKKRVMFLLLTALGLGLLVRWTRRDRRGAESKWKGV